MVAVVVHGRVALFASSVSASVRARQLQGIGRQDTQVCARLAEHALSADARTQAMLDECGPAN
jgi:hypothetical protein